MGLFDKLKTRSLENPATPISNPANWLVESMGGVKSSSGQLVNESTALSISAVWACVRIISETVASLPLMIYERTDNGKKLAFNHPLYKILHDEPNQDITSMSWRESKGAHVLLRGNGYSFINRNPTSAKVNSITLLDPGNVLAHRVNGELAYKVTINGTAHNISPSDIIHIAGLGFDGITGYSPIAISRDNLGLSLATQEFGSKFFDNGAVLNGILEHPAAMGTEAISEFKKSWKDMFTGTSNAFKTAILEEGMTYKQIGIAPEDAQYLQTRKFQLSEIARIYRVPPHMLADLEKSSFSNIEQQSLDFVIHTLRPWLVRWEQELNRKLLSDSDRAKFFIKFKIEGLLRGDQKSRYESYQIGIKSGFMSPNDARSLEDLNRIKNGDIYLRPSNMEPINQAPKRKIDTILARECRDLKDIIKNPSSSEEKFNKFVKRHTRFLIDDMEIPQNDAIMLVEQVREIIYNSKDLRGIVEDWHSLRINQLEEVVNG